jgi:hypothetical protein
MEVIDYNDNILYVATDTKKSLEQYAEAERKLAAFTALPDLITWKSLANKILRNEVQKRGYYVGKKQE